VSGFDPQNRMGVVAESEATFYLVAEEALSFDNEAAPDVIIDARVSDALNLSVLSDNQPVSTLFGVDGVFTTPTDSMWGTSIVGGAIDGPIVVAFEYEISPIKYQRLDDRILAYTGGNLTSVTRESGDVTILTYDGNDVLIQVDEDYTGHRKILSYTNDTLTRVTTEKV